MKALSVKDLANWCNSAIKEGYGDRTILVAGDDEGNSYHCLYEGLSLAGDLFNVPYAPMLCANINPKEANEKILLLG